MPSNGSVALIWTKIEFSRQDLVHTTDTVSVEIYQVVVLSKMKHESERMSLYHVFILLLCVRKGKKKKAPTEEYVD
jgi:hypothetical protein